MAKLTKDQMETKISEEMVKFEKEFVGRGSGETDTIIYVAKVKRASSKRL